MPKLAKTQHINAESLVISREHVIQAYSVVRLIVRCGLGAYFIYNLKEMTISLAGQSTDIAVRLAFLSDLKFTASLTLAGAACAWAVAERFLRLRKVSYMQARIQSLETFIDPHRTSSRLTPSGTTNPEDSEL